MVTIKDIAREANVSFTTVSNVIHGNSKRVSEKTVKRVKEIMEKRGYVPNMGARALVGAKTKLIAFAYQSFYSLTESNIMEDTFMSQLTGCLERCLHEAGYDMLIAFIDSQNGILDAAKRWNVDGVVVIGTTPDQSCRLLESLNKPVAFIDCLFTPPKGFDNFLNVTLDDKAAAYEMTKYLISCGHKKIAFAARTKGEYENPDSLRRDGFLQAMNDAGLSATDNNVIYFGKTSSSRRTGLAEIYARRKEFTAVFASADMDAANIENYLQDLDVRVPQDISVAGFDGNFMSSIVRPTLTTMQQDIAAKASAAVNGLLALISGAGPVEQQVRIPVKLIERNSVIKITP